MGPMPIEDKKDKINSKLNTLYYKVIDSKDRKEFLRRIEAEFGNQAKNYVDLLKDQEVKDYYITQKNLLATRFEQEKNKNIYNDINIIDKKLNSKFRSALKSPNEEEFKKVYNNFKEELLKELKNQDIKDDINKYIEDWLKFKIEEFKDEKNKMKNKYIEDFLNFSYSELKDSSNSKEDLKEAIEAKKDNDDTLKEYLEKKDYQIYYNKIMNDKLIIFGRELNVRKNAETKGLYSKYQTFFNTQYPEVLKLSNNKEEFEAEYKNQLKLFKDLYDNFDNFKDYYNELLKNKYKSFEVDLNNKLKKEKSEIENDFYKFFNNNYDNICKISSDENQFRENFKQKREERTDLDKYFINGHNSQYETLLQDYVNKFNIYIKDKEKSDKTQVKNDYLLFLNNNYDKVQKISSTEEELESEYNKLLDEEENKNLKKNFSKNMNEYKGYLKDKISQFKTELENRIKTAYFDNYNKAIKSSKEESDFKTNLFNLLFEDSKLKKLLEKEEYKDYFTKLHDTDKIKDDLKDKENREAESNMVQTNAFFDDKYENIKNQSKNLTEFENKIKAIAPASIQNSKNFISLLTKYKNQFEREKKEEQKENDEKEKKKIYEEKEKKLIDDSISGIDAKNFEDTGSINHFKSFEQAKFENLFQKLFIEENYDKKIENKIDAYIKELLNDKNKKVNHLNILLCGNSGAGKSTLINGFLELEGENILKTDTGEAVTMETKYVSSPKFPIFRLGDSRGTEISKAGEKAYGIDEVVKSMNEFIQYQLNTKNPDNYVHCIWYCVIPLDGRFNGVVAECLNEIEKNYKINDGLPIIIVGTKAISENSNKKLKDYLISQKIKYPFHPVLAIKDGDIEPFGLEELRLLSLEKAIDGINSSCYQGIIKNIIETSKSKVEEQRHIIDGKIKQKQEEVFKSIENNPNFNNLKNYMRETFIIFLKQYSSINLSSLNNNITEDFKLGQKSKNEIEIFINGYYNYCKQYYEQNYEKIINKRTLELMDKIMKEKFNFISLNQVIVKTKSEDELKKEIGKKIENKLKKKADIYYFKNLYSELMKLLLEFFEDYFINSYNDIIKDKENEEKTKSLIISKISDQFKELKTKIEEYNKPKEKKVENGIKSNRQNFLANRRGNK